MHATLTHPVQRGYARIAAFVIALIAATAIMLGAAAPAHAHDQLVGFDADGQTFALHFNNDVLTVGSELKVTGPDGADAVDGLPKVSGRDVEQAIAANLPDGEYAAVWRVVSSDGHPIQGALTLTLSGGDITEIVAADTSAATEEANAGTDEGAATTAENPADGSADGGLDAGTIVWISIAGVLVLGAVIATVVAGQRKRAQGMGGSAADRGSDTPAA